jgi:hypothetical protein
MVNEDGRNLEEKIENSSNWKSNLGNGLKNYLVDTTAKVGTYALPMVIMEASKGMDFDEILQSRTTVALADSVLARIYGKSLNYTRKKFNPENKQGIRGYLVDTSTMLAIYVPAYAGILNGIEYFNDKDFDISSACLFLTGMLIGTARPFSKYVLDPWRKYWKTKQ